TGGRTTAMGYSGGDKVRQQFTSKERDPETGLDYFGARYYASTQGRFTSADPAGLKDNKFTDPQRWNLYSYALDNPLAYTDPDGLDALAVAFTDYKVGTPIGRLGNLGHAGIVLIDKKGHTTYYEYGRYDSAELGLVRSFPVPNLVMDKKGRPTSASLTKLLEFLSKKYGN